MSGRDHLLEARDLQIAASYLSGLTLQEIGDTCGITRERVRQILNRAGISKRHGGVNMPKRVEARSRREAALAAEDARRQGKKAARATLAQSICDNYREGMTYEAIASANNVSIGHVTEVVRKAGLMNRHPSMIGPKKRLSQEAKLEIARRYAAGEPIADIARDHNVVPEYVRAISYTLGVRRQRGSHHVDVLAPEARP